MRRNSYAQVLKKAHQRASTRYAEVRAQIDCDAAVIAANEVLGMGAGRAKAFVQAMIDNANEIGQLTLQDAKDDQTLAYTKEVVDRRIRAIVGDENFVPWDKRYGQALDHADLLDHVGYTREQMGYDK